MDVEKWNFTEILTKRGNIKERGEKQQSNVKVGRGSAKSRKNKGIVMIDYNELIISMY